MSACVCRYLPVSAWLSLCLCLSICLSVCLCMSVPVCLCAYVCLSLSVYRCLCLCLCLSGCLVVWLPVCPSMLCLRVVSLRLSVFVSAVPACLHACLLVCFHACSHALFSLILLGLAWFGLVDCLFGFFLSAFLPSLPCLPIRTAAVIDSCLAFLALTHGQKAMTKLVLKTIAKWPNRKWPFH